MPDNPLFDILRPAYKPCPNFKKACKGNCRWIPEDGHVPRAFGGATGGIEDVRLILVTAEPGNPADGEKYSGTPDKMLQHSMSVQNTFLEKGGLLQSGKGTQFHGNMRYILDQCWPKDSIKDQLKKTWITPSVLCSAKEPGGDIPERIEDTCVWTYLVPQINLLENAFVVALGGKAQRRLRRNGVRKCSDAQHPAARPNTQPEESWRKAAQAFRSWLKRDNGSIAPNSQPTGEAKIMTAEKKVAATRVNLATALTALNDAMKEVGAAHADLETALTTRKAPGEKKRRGGGGKYFSDDAVITLLLTGEAEINEKRMPSTNGRRYWEIYRNGMTVGEALEKGAPRHDLLWCFHKKFFKLTEPSR